MNHQFYKFFIQCTKPKYIINLQMNYYFDNEFIKTQFFFILMAIHYVQICGLNGNMVKRLLQKFSLIAKGFLDFKVSCFKFLQNAFS